MNTTVHEPYFGFFEAYDEMKAIYIPLIVPQAPKPHGPMHRRFG